MLQRAATTVIIAGKTGDSCGFECQSVLEEIRNGGENEREKREFQRLNRICTRCGGECGRRRKYLAFSLFMCKGRRRTVSDYLSGAGADIWFCSFDNGCGDREENKEKCTECICCDLSEVEISGISDVSGSGADYDLLFGHRRLDYEIFCGISGIWGQRACTGRIFHFIYHVKGSPDRVYAFVSGADSSGRLLRCGKGNRKGFELYYACAGCSDCGDCVFFPDAVGRRGGWCGSDGNAGTGDLSAAGFSWTDGETVSGNFAGCDEPAVFLPECFDGHHGDLWFLCKR